jgi:hypothetical protein
MERTPAFVTNIFRNRQNDRLMEAMLWIGVWLVTSPTIIASIKILTTKSSGAFPYPWLLTGFINSCAFVFCNALCHLPIFLPEVDSQSKIPWLYAGPLGVLQGIEVGIGAVLLADLSITLRTEIHMLAPAFVFLLTLCAGLESPEPRLCLSILFVTIGGLLASYNTMTWEGLALVPLALLASLLSTVRWVLTQKWLSPASGGKPSPINLTARMSPFTALTALLGAFVFERDAVMAMLHLPQPGRVALLILAVSLMVCILMVSEMRVVQLASALLFGFLVPFHNVTVILLDASIRGAKVSGVNWGGIMLCAVGTGFYLLSRKSSKGNEARRLAAGVENSSYQSIDHAPADAEIAHQRC